MRSRLKCSAASASKVYYGNPARPDLLRAAGAERASLLVVALDDMEEILQVVDVARRNFPNLKILSRSRNRKHTYQLMDRGIAKPVRETFHSSLRLSEMVLQELGVPKDEAMQAVEFFRVYDEREIVKTHSYYEDEQQVIQSARQAADELSGLFEADQQERQESGRIGVRPNTQKAVGPLTRE